MVRIRIWIGLLGLAALTLAVDVAAGPFVRFPIFFVIPVSLAASSLGRDPALGFAIVLVAARLLLSLTLDPEPLPTWVVPVNALIRLVVLAWIALLVARVVEQRRLLAAKVERLEGLLPTCSICRKIRRPDGEWESMESYIEHHSRAQFSHGLCDACLRANYPEFGAPR